MAKYSQIDAAGVPPTDLPSRHQNIPSNSNDTNRPNHGHTLPYARDSTANEETRDPEDEQFIFISSRPKPGLAILIINSQFDYESNRDYAQKDLENMQDIFQALGFEIRLMRNLTTTQLDTELKEVSRENYLQNIDYLACVISSHGSENEIGKGERDEYLPDHITVYEHFISTKDGKMRTRNILEIFDDNNCRPLRGKPKLFFIQACRSRFNAPDHKSRGGAFDEGVQVDVIEERTTNRRPLQHDPNLSGRQNDRRNSESRMDAAGTMHQNVFDDRGIAFYEHTRPILPKTVLAPPVCLNHFLVMFSSVSENVGWSDERGGWLLGSLYDVLKERIREQRCFSLIAALIEVNRKVAIFKQSKTADARFDCMKSIPCMEYKLTKEIFLEPIFMPASQVL